MTSKSPKLLLLAVTLFFFLFESCKKGEGDPAFSLRSRKARLEGRWRLTGGNAGLTLLDPGGAPFAQSFVLDGSTANATQTQSSGPPTLYKFAFLLNIEIKKDGSFTLTETFGSTSFIAHGTWNFTGGIGEVKNKEEVVFVIEEVTSDQTTNHLFNKQATEFTYRIVTLRNKELKLESGVKEYINANGKSLGYQGTYEFIQS